MMLSDLVSGPERSESFLSDCPIICWEFAFYFKKQILSYVARIDLFLFYRVFSHTGFIISVQDWILYLPQG